MGILNIVVFNRCRIEKGVNVKGFYLLLIQMLNKTNIHVVLVSVHILLCYFCDDKSKSSRNRFVEHTLKVQIGVLNMDISGQIWRPFVRAYVTSSKTEKKGGPFAWVGV